MDFDHRRHKLRLIDALRYVGGVSRNIPTRNMLRHLERSGFVIFPESAAPNGFALTPAGRKFLDQAEEYYSSRVLVDPLSMRMVA